MENETAIEYKNLYTGIFSAYYFIEGMNQSILAVIVPIYLLNILGSIKPSELTLIASVVLIPWAIKLIFGILSDKISIKNFGRRRPWIVGSGFLGGIIWILIPQFLPQDASAVTFFAIAGFMIMLGVAMGDTALDGLLLDICPKEQLGRSQGFCWGFRNVGVIAGGPLIAVLIAFVSVEMIFVIFGILMILFSLLTLVVKEAQRPAEFEIGTHLKNVFTTGKNWKVFVWAFFDTIVEAVVVLFVALYLLIQMDFVQPVGATIDLLEEDINLYIPQANINLIIALGIIGGALLGGYVADLKSRKIATYLGYVVAISSYLLMIINLGWIMFIVFAIVVGVGFGIRNAAYAAVLGEVSQKYPEIDSTYYSIGTSMSNLGSTIGLLVVGAMFDILAGFTSDILVIYSGIFLFMAIIQVMGPIFFAFIKSEEYELKKIEKKD